MVTFGGSAVDLYRFGSDQKLSHTVTMEFGALISLFYPNFIAICIFLYMHFTGIKSLFKICALFINKNKKNFEDHLCLLPVKVLAYVNDCLGYDKTKKLL